MDKWGFYEKLNISLDECFDYFSKAWGDWQNLHPMERHLDQKTKMLQNLAQVDIVTAVRPEHLKDISQWLDYNHIHYRNLVHSDAKETLDYDIYIDDAERNIQKVYDAGKIGLLYNQAWNRNMKDVHQYEALGLKEGGMIKRVYNLYNAIDEVREIVKEE